MRRQLLGAALLLLLASGSAFAQQTAGNIAGRIVDQQGAAVPGATVTAKNPATGFTRSEVSDASGLYRLGTVPIGTYEVTAELAGFATLDAKGVEVSVGQTATVDFTMKVATVAETINVTGQSPLIETTNAVVGQVVDPKRIESLPLNGRQFANLAATIPGVGLGFHSDPTKNTQYAPQINGGAGRNVNYQIDGGDNNDDTVGGLLEQFPLEAVQEFNFQTQRFKAEYGRSNGGVLAVVTKSGSNTPSGSFFEFFRNKALNAESETQILNNTGKTDYSRNQFGGSFGGPIVKDKAQFFFALERTQQDTTQSVSTKGLFPTLDGVNTLPYRENLGTGKVTMNLNPAQFHRHLAGAEIFTVGQRVHAVEGREKALRADRLRRILLRPLEREEELRFVLHDRAAEAAAELVAAVIGLAGVVQDLRLRLGVQRLVAEELEEAARRREIG